MIKNIAFLENATIKLKLTFLAGVLLAFLVVISSVSGFYLYSLNSNVDSLKESSLDVTKQADHINMVLTQQQEELKKLELLNSVNLSFLKFKFWLSDLSVSWVYESEDKAEAARLLLLKRLSEVKAFAPNEVKEIAKHLDKINNAYLNAVEVYVINDRMSGNILIAKANAESLIVQNILKLLIEKQAQAVINAKESAINAAVATLTHASDMDDVAGRAVKLAHFGLNVTFIGVILSIIIALILTFIIIRSILEPLSNIVASVQKIAEGDLDAELPCENKTEIGKLVRATIVLKKNSIAAEKLRKAQLEESKLRLERTDKIDALVVGFDTKTSKLLGALAVAANQMEATSQTMTSLADETSSRSTSVAGAAEEAGTNVQNVAAAAEELSVSIKEMMNNIETSQKFTQEASDAVNHTEVVISELSEAAEQISEVVGMITDIAEQTNLLALNATIEAARAGDAGKGFAVVASEVKGLASETASATDQIAGIIAKIQENTKSAVNAIDEVSKTILRVNEISAEVTTSIHQQAEATQEIARSVAEAAVGTKDVTQNITSVSSAAAESGQSASDVLNVAKDLAKQSDSMKQEIEGFLADIKTA